MTKFSHLGRKSAAPSRKKVKIFKRGVFNLKHLNATLGVLAVVFGVGYLILMNGLATTGYQIKDLQQQLSILQDTNSDLKLETLSLQSLDTVKQKVDKLGLVAVSDVEYLNSTPVALAK